MREVEEITPGSHSRRLTLLTLPAGPKIPWILQNS